MKRRNRLLQAIALTLAAGLTPGVASAYNCNYITKAVQNHERLLTRQIAQPALSGFNYHPSIMSLSCASQMDSIFSGYSSGGMAAMGLGGMPMPANILQQADNQVMNRVTNMGCAPVQAMQNQYHTVLDQAANTPAEMIPSAPPYDFSQFQIPPVTAGNLP